jgi:hypothetical protein
MKRMLQYFCFAILSLLIYAFIDSTENCRCLLHVQETFTCFVARGIPNVVGGHIEMFTCRLEILAQAK